MSKIVTNILPETHMFDLVIVYPNTITVLERMNIPFGFGEKTVEELAIQYNLNLQAFMAVLKVFSGKYLHTTVLEKEAIKDVLTFLKVSHQYFKEIQIPSIRELIRLFAENLSGKHGEMIISFFDGYIKEVTEHFMYEEEKVFPYIETFLKDFSPADFGISEFEKNHTDIEQKLLDLKYILIKYLPEEIISTYRLKILKELKILEDDLYYHSFIEGFILVPSVRELEKEVKKQGKSN